MLVGIKNNIIFDDSAKIYPQIYLVHKEHFKMSLF